MGSGKLFVISAPSGTGKTTILRQVMADIERLEFSVSHTTRKPREGETNGVDYHFVAEHEFIEMQDNDLFLESAQVHKNYYGTSIAAALSKQEQGVDVVLDIDVQGATILMDNKGVEASFIFIAPPSLSSLEERLRGRASDSEETIAVRLGNAAGEMEYAPKYDYLVVNENLDEAVRLVKAIILAERAKSRRLISGLPIQSMVG